VVERLPSKRKALGSVPSSEKKKKEKKKKNKNGKGWRVGVWDWWYSLVVEHVVSMCMVIDLCAEEKNIKSS